MEFIDPKLQEYCESHSTGEDHLLNELNRHTHLNVLRPRMLSGALQGQYLTMLARMMNATKVLEIGTYTGYSAICLAKGMNPEGKLWTIDCNEELEDLVNSYSEKAGFSDVIEMHVGEALELIPKMDLDELDLVFIDADKENYLEYYKLVLPLLSKGGLIIADNVLWSGKVIQDLKKGDRETEALLEFNDYVQKDKSVEISCFRSEMD